MHMRFGFPLCQKKLETYASHTCTHRSWTMVYAPREKGAEKTPVSPDTFCLEHQSWMVSDTLIDWLLRNVVKNDSQFDRKLGKEDDHKPTRILFVDIWQAMSKYNVFLSKNDIAQTRAIQVEKSAYMRRRTARMVEKVRRKFPRNRSYNRENMASAASIWHSRKRIEISLRTVWHKSSAPLQ